ncbi:MAG: hypothetical protein ABI844_10520 [Saprospiraceae bacterium]
MKNYLFMGLTAIALFITSCQKTAENEILIPDSSLELAATNNAESQMALESIEYLQDELLESRDNGTCPEITSTEPKGIFPNTVTIDYGAGCTDKKGRFHSGKIIIEQSDSLKNTGAIRRTMFADFGMDSMRIKNGEILLSHGQDANGNTQFVRKTMALTFTGPKGTIEVNAHHIRTQIQGGETNEKSDDVWKMEGESTGTVDGNIKFQSMIKEALILKNSCPFIVSGKETISRNGHEINIDFGDGSCDRLAKGTTENGKELLIVLRPRF